MREQEAALWGAASAPSRVVVQLDGNVSATERVVFNSVPNKLGTRFNSQPAQDMRDLAYGAFALQPKSGVPHQLPPGVIHRVQGNLRLTLSVPQDNRVEVERAVDAWLALGGIGGRIRRAFGAVEREPAWTVDELERWLNKNIGAAATLPMVPTLCGARWTLTRRRFESSLKAAKFGLTTLQGFRQAPGTGRNEGQMPNRPGRSRWPEADFIRRLMNRTDPLHAEPLSRIDKFPRAAFGMPIIFHFQSQQDPEDATLHPRNYERMASPLIIRPVRTGDAYECLALVLAVPGATQQSVVLESGALNGGPRVIETVLTAAEAAKVRPLDGERDPLDAFLRFFNAKGQ
jgi:CRISPR-associated protein Cmr1